MTDTMLSDDDVMNQLRALATTAAPTATARPDLAATVIRRGRTRRFRRVGFTLGAGALVAVGVAASGLPGHGNYYSVIQPSGAMEPTIGIGDTAVFSKTLSPAHGDVVRVHLVPSEVDLESTQQHAWYTTLRVIGMPGDTVTCGSGTAEACTSIEVNGARIAQPYLPSGSAFKMRTFSVPAGSALLLGDHRDFANDSRNFGPVPLSAVTGVAVGVDVKGGGHRGIPGAPVHEGPSNSDSVDPPAPIPPAFTDVKQ